MLADAIRVFTVVAFAAVAAMSFRQRGSKPESPFRLIFLAFAVLTVSSAILALLADESRTRRSKQYAGSFWPPCRCSPTGCSASRPR